MNEKSKGERVLRGAIIIGLLSGAAIGLSACGGGAPAGADAPDLGADAGRGVSIRDLVPLLTRYGVGPGQAGIDLTYAPEAFFDIAGLARPAEMDSRPTLAFIMQEAIHEGDLPTDPPSVYMEVEGGDRVSPYSAQVTADDPHHRTVRLLFPEPSGWSGEDLMRLVVPLGDGTVSAGNVFEWQLPIDLGGAGESEKG